MREKRREEKRRREEERKKKSKRMEEEKFKEKKKSGMDMYGILVWNCVCNVWILVWRFRLPFSFVESLFIINL